MSSNLSPLMLSHYQALGHTKLENTKDQNILTTAFDRIFYLYAS